MNKFEYLTAQPRRGNPHRLQPNGYEGKPLHFTPYTNVFICMYPGLLIYLYIDMYVYVNVNVSGMQIYFCSVCLNAYVHIDSM